MTNIIFLRGGRQRYRVSIVASFRLGYSGWFVTALTRNNFIVFCGSNRYIERTAVRWHLVADADVDWRREMTTPSTEIPHILPGQDLERGGQSVIYDQTSVSRDAGHLICRAAASNTHSIRE